MELIKSLEKELNLHIELNNKNAVALIRMKLNRLKKIEALKF